MSTTSATRHRHPCGALIVFTGVSDFDSPSLTFGTLYAEAQRRYL